jgi:hypothetical protein
MSDDEILAAIKKHEDLHKTDKAIIADKDTKITRLENEIANLRAGGAVSSEPSEPQTLPQIFNSAVDMLARLDGVTPDRWPKKISTRTV